MDFLCKEIEALLPGATCSVLTVDPSGLIHPLSAPSLPCEYSASLNDCMVGPNVGSCGSAVYLGKPIVVTNIETDPRWAEFKVPALRLGLNACWSTPIFCEAHRVAGAFAIYHRACRGPDESEEAIIATSVRLCAIALDRHERVLERERRASVDALTRLANRASFNLTLNHLPCGEPGTWALLILDLDNLKIVNDTFGHHAGDHLLQVVAARIEASASPNRAFRIGGDEFAILVQSTEALQNLDAFASQILNALGAAIQSGGHTIMPQATIGGAVYAAIDRTAEAVRQNADFALYHAKETGRGGFVRYWAGLDTRITHRLSTIRDVDAALREGRIEPFYQPIIRLDTLEIVGMEALCRLRTRNGASISAANFHEATNDVGIASTLTHRMLMSVASDIRSWSDLKLSVGYVGINLSPADIYSCELERALAAISANDAIQLEQVVFEIAASTFPAQREAIVIDRIKSLRSMGVCIALDNFGTSTSSLLHLMAGPIDIIKIDKKLIGCLGSDDANVAILEGILLIAKKLGIGVVAKGIETQVEADHLAVLGCEFGQGFLFLPPITSEQVPALLSRGLHEYRCDPKGMSSTLEQADILIDEAAPRSSQGRRAL